MNWPQPALHWPRRQTGQWIWSFGFGFGSGSGSGLEFEFLVVSQDPEDGALPVVNYALWLTNCMCLAA